MAGLVMTVGVHVVANGKNNTTQTPTHPDRRPFRWSIRLRLEGCLLLSGMGAPGLGLPGKPCLSDMVPDPGPGVQGLRP